MRFHTSSQHWLQIIITSHYSYVANMKNKNYHVDKLRLGYTKTQKHLPQFSIKEVFHYLSRKYDTLNLYPRESSNNSIYTTLGGV